jgi:S-adenosylmethionine:tRNA ribosyltransferase-isomerase
MGDLPDFIPAETGVIFNNTRVIKARLLGRKATGGQVELLLTRPLQSGFACQIRGRVREGVRLLFDRQLEAEVIALNPGGDRTVRFFEAGSMIGTDRLFELLESIGHVPLPPYIRREDNAQDRHDYQTRFASQPGSVAAPTASLHFSDALLERVRSTHPWAEVTLHVGPGTFKGVESADIRAHTMHSERYEIPAQARTLIKSDRPLLAVGTTACRTIEHFVRTGASEGECDLFLHPGNPPLRTNHLMTNFHLPKSTLLMLVASFVGLKTTHALYAEAIKERYRFYSYGDGMLIL